MDEILNHTRDADALRLAFVVRDDNGAGRERELLNLTLTIRKDQWRDADWQRQALLKTKEAAQTNRRYYARFSGRPSDPNRTRSYDRGPPRQVGNGRPGHGESLPSEKTEGLRRGRQAHTSSVVGRA